MEQTQGGQPERWHLALGDEDAGDVLVESYDFPWVRGTFTPGPAYAVVSELFERELALMDAEQWDECDAVLERLRDLGLRLLRPDGSAVAEMLLHIDGTSAWFRWSDEPFADI